MKYPIDPELVKMNALLPVKLSELSHKNPNAALELLQAWGERTMKLRDLWKETNHLLDGPTSSKTA